jgi:hypothetical protein
MPSINQLNAADQLSGSDLLALYSQANGDARKISLTNLLNWLESQQIATQDNKITQYAAPLAASTTLLRDDQSSLWLILTPAGTIATATLKLPLVANAVDRQEILVNSTQIITALTLDANGGTIIGGPTALAANGFFRLRFDAVMKTWYRVG